MKSPMKLSAVVTLIRPAAEVRVRSCPGRQIRHVSEITIRYGREVVGRATLGGWWNADQALQEFRRFPKRFGADRLPALGTRVEIKRGRDLVASADLVGSVSAAEALVRFATTPQLFSVVPTAVKVAAGQAG
jgi:hypothetical protein